MKIVVDGMGGDNGAVAVVDGCVQALKEIEAHIVITGQQEVIEEELKKYEYDKNRITVVDCREVIATEENPTMAIRKKKDSSLVRGLKLVKEGECDAIVSSGSTGALLTGATLIVGRIKGIKRPALAPVMPGKNSSFMVIDAGANVDCKPENLLQFGMMGKIYFENVLNVSNPKVGLINIGAEESKGNELTKKAFELLKANEEELNFVGNVEPRDVPTGDVEVLVCDGFVGNTVLKMYEGVAMTLLSMIKAEIYSSTRTKLGGLLIKPAMKRLMKKADYKETGGAAFLGVKGVCVKAHGSSDATAIRQAIKQAAKFTKADIVAKIEEGLEKTKVVEG